MAENLEDLYFRLGLEYDKLQADFVDAEKTISSNLRRLNREQNLVQLRAQIQMNGLTEAEIGTKGLKIAQESLAQQMKIQQDRIALVNASYQEMRATQGDTAEITQQLALELEKERLVMSRLEQQTRALNEQQKISIGLNYELLGLIEPAMKGIDHLQNAGRALPPHAKAIAAAFIGLMAIVTGTMEATGELLEKNSAQILSIGFSDAQDSISNDLGSINADVAKTTEAIDRNFQTSAANIQRSTQSMASDYESYTQDILRLIQIITSETETLNDTLRAVNSQVSYMQTGFGKYGAMAIGVAKTFEALGNSAISFAQPAIDGYRDLNKAASELNLPVSVTSDMLNTAKLAGGEFEDVRDWVRGIQDAILKGERDDPEAIALKKYGIVIQDLTGNLLDFQTTHDRLIEGAVRAAEAGELESFAIMTQGEGIKDILPYLKSIVQAKQDFNKIRWSTTDEAALKETSHNLKLAEVQAGELEAALSSLGVPLANLAAEAKFEWVKTLTDLIEDNRETILFWEFAFIEAFKRVENFVVEKANILIDKISAINDTFGITDKIKDLASMAADIIPEGEGGSIFDAATEALNEYIDVNEKARLESEKTAKVISDLSYSTNRIREYKKELEEINRELKFGDNTYQKSLSDLNAWRADAMENAEAYPNERMAIEELNAAKRAKIEAERAKALQDIRDRIKPQGGTEVERRFIEIEKERQAWVNLGMSIEESYELAQVKFTEVLQEETDKRNEKIKQAKNLLQQAADAEYHATHNALENQFYDINRWKEEQLERATTAEEVSAIIASAASKEAVAIKNSLERVNSLTESTAAREFHATHTQLENQLYDIEQWKSAQMEKAETAEEVTAIVAEAASKEAEAIEDEAKRISGVIESAQDRLAKLKLSKRDYELYKARQQYAKDLEELPQVLADELFFAELSRIRATQNGRSLGYNEKPPQYYDQDDPADRQAVKNLFDGLQQRLPTALKVNPETFGKYKAQEKYTSATGKAATATEEFGKKIDTSGKSVTEFTKAIQGATKALSGKGKGGGDSSVTRVSTALGAKEQNPLDPLKEMLGREDPDKIPIHYLDAIWDSLDALDSGTRDRLDAILNSLPEGIDVSQIKELIRDNAEGGTVLYGDALNEQLNNLGDDVRSKLEAAFDEQKETGGLAEQISKLNETMATAAANFEKAAEKYNEALKQKQQETPAPESPKQQELPKLEAPKPEGKLNLPTLDSNIMDKALKGTATLGEIMAVGGLATLQPELALLGAGIQATANTLQTARELTKDLETAKKSAPEKTPEPKQPSEPKQPEPKQQEIPTPEISFAQVEQSLEEFGDKLKGTGEASAALTESLNATASTIDATREKLSQVDFGTAIQPVGEQVEILRQGLESAGQSMTTFAESVNLAAERIAQINFQNPSAEWQPPELQQQPESTTLAEIRAQVQQSIELQGQLITEIQAASVTQAQAISELRTALKEPQQQGKLQQLVTAQAQIISEIQQFSAMTTPLLSGIISAVQIATAQLSQQITGLAESMAAAVTAARDAADAAKAAKAADTARIAQGTSRAQTSPTINISPNINLAGAYVFDNAMKQQLTDDITNEVANGVRDAMSTIGQGSYGYGN